LESFKAFPPSISARPLNVFYFYLFSFIDSNLPSLYALLNPIRFLPFLISFVFLGCLSELSFQEFVSLKNI
jgi:hypothetical protein